MKSICNSNVFIGTIFLERPMGILLSNLFNKLLNKMPIHITLYLHSVEKSESERHWTRMLSVKLLSMARRYTSSFVPFLNSITTFALIIITITTIIRPTIITNTTIFSIILYRWRNRYFTLSITWWQTQSTQQERYTGFTPRTDLLASYTYLLPSFLTYITYLITYLHAYIFTLLLTYFLTYLLTYLFT